MRELVVDNYVINEPILNILYRLQATLTNGKLKDILPKSDNILVTCPSHDGGKENKPACNIYVGNNEEVPYGYFRCFVCEEQGSFLKFVAKCFDSSLDYAKNWLINTFSNQLVEKQVFLGDDIKLTRKVKTRGLDKSILEGYINNYTYLQKRGISKAVCEKFNIKYDPKYKQVIFPCYDTAGNLIMMPKRSTIDKMFYLDKDIEKPVYCLDYIIKNNIKTVMITEGPIDCLSGWTFGIPTIATLGQPSDEQIDKINKSCITTLYLCMDNDKAGRGFTRILKWKLNKRIILKEVQLPNSKKDINDCTKEEFDIALQKAQNSI